MRLVSEHFTQLFLFFIFLYILTQDIFFYFFYIYIIPFHRKVLTTWDSVWSNIRWVYLFKNTSHKICKLVVKKYLKTLQITWKHRHVSLARLPSLGRRQLRRETYVQTCVHKTLPKTEGHLLFFFFFFFIPPPHYSTRVRVWRGGLPSTACGYYLFIQLFFSLNNPFFFFPFLRTFFFTFFFVFFLAFFFIYIFFKSMIVIDTCQNYSTTWIVHYKHNNYYKITDFYWCSL